jgi:hypothetical protein
MSGGDANDRAGRRAGPHTIRLAFGGLVLAGVILFAEEVASLFGLGRGFIDDEPEYVRRPQTLLWLLLIATQVALWAALLARIRDRVEGLRAGSEGSRRRSQAYALALIAPVTLWQLAAFVSLHRTWPFPGQSVKISLVTALALGVASVAAVGVARIYTIAEKAEARAGDGALAERIDGYLALRHALDRLLGAMAAIVAAGVLATGALRNAVLSWETTRDHPRPPGEVFPQEQVLLFGLFFTGLLALLAIPAYDRLHTLGEKLRERHVEQAVPDANDWKGRAEERATVDRLLRLEGAGLGGFRAGAAILAPLATSLVSTALGGG